MTGYRTHCFSRVFFFFRLKKPSVWAWQDRRGWFQSRNLNVRAADLRFTPVSHKQKNSLFLNSFNIFFCQLAFSPLSLYTCQVKFFRLPKITITKTRVLAGTYLQPGTESCWDFPALLLPAFHSFGFHFYLLWYKLNSKKEKAGLDSMSITA